MTAPESERRPETPADKVSWRDHLIRRRRSREPSEIVAARQRITAHLLPLASPGIVICAYLPLPTEPLDLDLIARSVEKGAVVLVPVASPSTSLDWCRWDADLELRRSSFGIAEPAGVRLGPAAIGEADLVLVPALAVDRHGHRLGRGGGHYDRSLALLPQDSDGGFGPARRTPRLIAVVFDDEVVDDLPHDALDRPVTEVVTPSNGIRPLG
jgi:5-formyltetrahydrofolate cyclo-ligase